MLFRSTGEEIGALLRELNAAGQSLVIVTHNPGLAAAYATRTIGITDGRITSDTGGLLAASAARARS